MSRIFLVSLAFALCACSQFSTIKVTDQRTGIEYEIPKRLSNFSGIEKLAKACVSDAGRVVHRTVQVEGYLNPGMSRCDEACWHIAALMPYQYNEFEVIEVKFGDYIQETGYWRITKEKPGDPRCQKEPTEYVKKIADRKGWDMNFCLAMEKVDSLKSSYSHKNWIEEEKLGDEFGSSLVKGISVIEHIASGEVIAMQTNFTLYSKYRENWPSKQLGCQSIGIDLIKDNFIEAVILPK